MQTNTIIIQDDIEIRILLFIIVFSVAGIFLTHLIVAIIDKFGYRGINIFYRRKADELDVRIEKLEESISKERMFYKQSADLIEEIKIEIKKISDGKND